MERTLLLFLVYFGWILLSRVADMSTRSWRQEEWAWSQGVLGVVLVSGYSSHGLAMSSADLLAV